MNLTLTHEQTALTDVVARIFAKNASADSPGGQLWATLAESGLLGLSAPESRGGSGAGLLEEFLLFVEAGRTRVAAPLFAGLALAQPFLLATGSAGGHGEQLVSGLRTFTLAWCDQARPYGLVHEAIAVSLQVRHEDGQPLLSGRRRLVPNLCDVDSAVVLDGRFGAFVVDLSAPGVDRSAAESLDSAWSLGSLVLTDAPAVSLLDAGTCERAAGEAFARAILLAAAESVGIAEAVLTLAVAHASARTQFGRAIGSFQAVSHPLVNIYADLETTRSLAIMVMLHLEAGTLAQADLAGLALSAAGLGIHACEKAIQAHGGIGITWESDLHRYYKRARLLRVIIGPANVHRAVISRALSS